MPTMSIGRALTWLADQDPDRAAVTDSQRSVSRRELDLRSNRLARAYAELGVRQDDLVTVGLPNGVEYYEACAAIWKLGATPQPVSAKLPPAELTALVELADPPLLVGVDLPGRASAPADLDVSGYGDRPLPDRVAASWKAPTSGGSTGRPKIIVAGTPGETDPETPGVAAAFNLTPNAVQLVPGPLYHNAPFTFSMQGLFPGGHLIVMSRFDASAAL